MKGTYTMRLDLGGQVFWLQEQDSQAKAEVLAKEIKKKVTSKRKQDILQELVTLGFELIYNPYNDSFNLRSQGGSYAEKHLSFDDVMTFPEAAEKWGLGDSTLREAARNNRFEEGELRKSGKVWLVTKKAMRRLYGMNEKMRKQMIEKLAEAGSILVDSAWVKENDEEVYDFLLEKIEMFAADPVNSTAEEDVELFEAGEYLVEYYFSDSGMGYAAGRTKQAIANQPNWGEDSWDDIADESIEKYSSEMK